MPEGVNELG
jgi:hypothetical protein